jgi:outer membrane protein assembly factor BamB
MCYGVALAIEGGKKSMVQIHFACCVVLVLVLGSLLPVSHAGASDDQGFMKVQDNEIAHSSNTDWWPMFHHDLSHIGYSTSLAPETNFTLWTYTTGYAVSSSPAIVDWKVYFGSEDGNVYCLDALTGVKLWNYSTGHLVCSSPAVYENMVYVGTNDAPGSNGSKLYCLDASTGEHIWEYATGDENEYGMYSSPAVADGRVYIGSGDHKVYCFDAMTGTKLWDFSTNGEVVSSPALMNGKVYVGSLDSNLYCLNASTGAQLWFYPAQGQIRSSPAVANGKVYFGASKMYCLDAETGAHIWDQQHDFLYSSPAVYNGKVYICDTMQDVYCFNATYGWVLWQYETEPGYAYMFSSPAVADGKIYVGAGDGEVYCLNANTSEKIWDYATEYFLQSSPAVASGRMYIGDMSGKMICFGEVPQPPEAPILYGPDAGVVNVSYTFYINQIMSPDGDQSLVICEWGDGNVSMWDGPFIPGQNISGSHRWYRPGWYGVIVKLIDQWGASSPWSNPVWITIADNKPPNIPKIDGPTRKRPGTYNYTFCATDPDGDNVSYQIDWGDGTYDYWVGSVPSGEVLIQSHTFSKIGTYSIKARAKDINGALGDWGTIPIRIPVEKMMPAFLELLFERFPNAFPFLRNLLNVP